MSIYMLLICSLVLLVLAGNAFYVTFKRYEDDDDFTAGVNTTTFIDLFVAITFLLSEKFLPKKYHIIFFKISSFLFGIFMVGVTILLWVLF